MIGRTIFKRACYSGSIAGLLMAASIAATGRLASGDGTRTLNGISHMLWRSSAAGSRGWSYHYTGSGLLLNQLACIFWAGCYEAITHDRSPTGRTHIRNAVAVSALAYLTDYHVVPRRFTPGFEHSLARGWFPLLYAALAASLLGGHVLHKSVNRMPPQNSP